MFYLRSENHDHDHNHQDDRDNNLHTHDKPHHDNDDATTVEEPRPDIAPTAVAARLEAGKTRDL